MIKLLEKNTGKLYSIGYSNGFLDITSKTQQHVEEEIIWSTLKLKIVKSCSSGDIMERVRRQSMEWNKQFANYIAGKDLATEKCKELLQLNNKKTTQLKTEQRS